MRGAYLDRRRGYFNGPCVFVLPEGRDDEPIEVTLEPPPQSLCEDWRVATALTPVEVDERGFGTYSAPDYDELLDHPVEISDFESVEFEAAGVPHHLVVAGRFESDLERVAADLQQMCEAQIEFFGRPAPFDRYWFLGLAVGDGYGGLEHRASTSLIFSRDDLPKAGETGQPRDYQRFLALASHEYFHTWHVKRTQAGRVRAVSARSAQSHAAAVGVRGHHELLPGSHAAAQRSRRLAAFLQRLGELLTRVYRMPGRFKQSLADSSFDAWDVLYQPGAEPSEHDHQLLHEGRGGRARARSQAAPRDRRADIARRRGARAVAPLRRARHRRARGRLRAARGRARRPRASRSSSRAPCAAPTIRPLQELLAEFGVELELRAAAGGDDRGGTPRAGNGELLRSASPFASAIKGSSSPACSTAARRSARV